MDQFSDTLLKQVFHSPTISNAKTLIEYLESIGGKKLKLTALRQSTFKLRKEGNPSKEVRSKKLRNRCHVQSAAIYLDYLLKPTDEEVSDQIKVVIADLCRIIDEVDPKQDTAFIIISTNTLTSYLHYKHAESIFYYQNLQENKKGNYYYDLLSLYALRLAFEARIHGFLGVDYILNNNKPIGLSQIIRIVKSLDNIIYSEHINWDEIEWINNWLNHHMHRHIRPYPWVIHQAFEVLRTMFDPHEYQSGSKTTASIYASTVVPDYEQLKEKFSLRLKSEFKGAKIEWSIQREFLEDKSSKPISVKRKECCLKRIIPFRR